MTQRPNGRASFGNLSVDSACAFVQGWGVASMAIQFDDAEALGAWAHKFRVGRVSFGSNGNLTSVEFTYPDSQPSRSLDGVMLASISSDDVSSGDDLQPKDEYEARLLSMMGGGERGSSG